MIKLEGFAAETSALAVTVLISTSPFGHDFSALQQRCVAPMGQHFEAFRDTVCAITTKHQ
jgi:hypothetical protein